MDSVSISAENLGPLATEKRDSQYYTQKNHQFGSLDNNPKNMKEKITK